MFNLFTTWAALRSNVGICGGNYKFFQKWLRLHPVFAVNILNVIETMLLTIICCVTTKKINNTSRKALEANESLVRKSLLIHCCQKNISEVTHSARVKAFTSHLRKEEVKKYFLQSVVEQTSPWELLLAKAINTSQYVNTAKLLQDFVSLRESIYNTYPEMRLTAAESVTLNISETPTPKSMVNFVLDNKNLLCKTLLEVENGKVLCWIVLLRTKTTARYSTKHLGKVPYISSWGKCYTTTRCDSGKPEEEKE